MPNARHGRVRTHFQQPLRPRLVSARHVLRHHFDILVRYLLDLERNPHSLREGAVRVPEQDKICGLGMQLRGPGRWARGCAGGNGAA